MLNYLISKDIELLNIIRGLIDTKSTIEVLIVKAFSDSEVILVAIFLVLLWLYWTYKKQNEFKEKSLLLFYSIAFSFIIYVLLNLWLPARPRPETVSAIRPLVDHLPDNSFPSWHAIFAWASVIWAYSFLKKKWISAIFLLISALMLLSRVMAWIHYPWDVIVWFLIWSFFSYIFCLFSSSAYIKKYLIAYPIKIVSYIKL